jgi:hypothetical protein
VAFRKVNGIRQLNHLPQEIRACSKALYDARNLFSSRPGSPEVVRASGFARSLSIFDDSNFGRRFWLVLRSGYGLAGAIVVRHDKFFLEVFSGTRTEKSNNLNVRAIIEQYCKSSRHPRPIRVPQSNRSVLFLNY